MQLQQVLGEFERAGVALFAISYDSVPTLAEFAGTRGITYPLLSDQGSAFIRRLGILNTLIEPSEEIHGIPFPGCYLLDTQGRVARKYFFQHYRDRPAPLAVLREAFGADVDLSAAPHAEAHTTVEGRAVRVTAVLGDRTLVPYQHTPLYVRAEGARVASVAVTGDEHLKPGVPTSFTAPDGAPEVAVPLRYVNIEADRATLDVTVTLDAPGAPSVTLRVETPVARLARRDVE